MLTLVETAVEVAVVLTEVLTVVAVELLCDEAWTCGARGSAGAPPDSRD
jgi:hypothetical protein